jgi:hypothetical protein
MDNDNRMNLTPLQYWLIVIIGCLVGISLLLYGIIGTVIHNLKINGVI